MKVFGISPNNNPSKGYCGGLVIIAANDADEAWKVIEEADDFEVDSYYFYKEDIEEIPHLSTDLTEPQIIIQEWYVE